MPPFDIPVEIIEQLRGENHIVRWTLRPGRRPRVEEQRGIAKSGSVRIGDDETGGVRLFAQSAKRGHHRPVHPRAVKRKDDRRRFRQIVPLRDVHEV
jgi:hypothetical protein